MLAFLYLGLAVHLFWSFLPHDGYSSTPDRIALIERAVAFLRAHFPHLRGEGVLADREFIGEAGFRYLEEKGILRCIRIKALMSGVSCSMGTTSYGYLPIHVGAGPS